MAKFPCLNSANDAQIQKKFRFVQEIGPQSGPGQEKQNVPPPGSFERIGQFFFEKLSWSAKLLFFSPFFQASRLGRTFSDLSKKFEQNGTFGIYPKFFFQDLYVISC